MGKYDALFAPDASQAQGKYSALFDGSSTPSKYAALFDSVDLAPELAQAVQSGLPQQPSVQVPLDSTPSESESEPWYQRAYEQTKAGDYRQALGTLDTATQQGIRRALNLPVTRPPTGQELKETGLEDVQQLMTPPAEAVNIPRPEETTWSNLPQTALHDIIGFAESPAGVAAPALELLGPTQRALVASGFGSQMLTDAIEKAKQGQYPEAVESGIFGLLGAHGAREAVKPEPVVPTAPPEGFEVNRVGVTEPPPIPPEYAERRFQLVPEPKAQVAPPPSLESVLSQLPEGRFGTETPEGFVPQARTGVVPPPETANIADLIRQQAAPETAIPSRAEPTVAEAIQQIAQEPVSNVAEAVRNILQGEAPAPVAETPALEIPEADKPYAGMTAPTSTKNAIVEQERAVRQLAPVEQAAAQDFPTAWDESARRIAQDPKLGQRLVDQFKAQPGAADDVTNAILLRESIKRQTEYDAAIKAVNDSAPGSPENTIAQARLEQASQDYYDVHQADRNAGTGTSRGLNARKMLADDQYNLAKMEARRRAANGGRPLNERQKAETSAAAAKLDDLRAKSDATQKAADKVALDAEFKRMTAELDREAATVTSPTPPGTPPAPDWLDAAAERARARMRDRATRMSTGIDPTALADAALVGAQHIRSGVREFGAWSKAMLQEFGETIRPHLDDLFKKANDLWRRYTDPNLRAYQTRLARQTAGLRGQLSEAAMVKAVGEDYTYRKAVRNKMQLDQQTFRMQAERNRVKNEFDRAVRKDELMNRPFLQRALDTTAKSTKAMKLAGIQIYGKLGAAAGTRLGLQPIEQAVQSVIGLALPERIRRAASLSGFNPRAEAAAFAGVVKGIKEAPGRILGRHAPEEELYGKPQLEPRSWLDIPAQTHAAVKAPVQEAARARATTMLTDHARRQGLDLNDPRVQQDIGTVADQEAKRSIFMQDNVVSDWWTNGMRSLQQSKRFPIAGPILATAGRILLPIVKVPTNIALEALITSPGGLVSGTTKLIQVMSRVDKSVTPAEANMIMGHYAKGTIGTGLFLTGYFMAANGQAGGFYEPGKRRPGAVAPMGMRFGGVNIPAWLLHAPAFITLQAGATAYNATHHTDKYGKPDQSATLRIASGFADEIPFMKEMGYVDKLLADNWEGQKARGQFITGNVVPQALKNIAQWTDPVKEPAYRSPATALDYLKVAVPGLREQVRVKGEPSTIPLTQQQQYRQLLKSQGIKPPKTLKQQIRELQKQQGG